MWPSGSGSRSGCIIPTTLVSALTEGEVLQALLVALLVGFALQAMGRRGAPILCGVGPSHEALPDRDVRGVDARQ